jgi:hypothetical protein
MARGAFRWLLLLVAALSFASVAVGQQVAAKPAANRAAKTSPVPAIFDPTERYVVKEVLGWRALVHESLLRRGDEPAVAGKLSDQEQADHAELGNRVLEQLNAQLYQIEYRLPKPAVDKLRQVRIWIEYNEPHHPCIVYHLDAQWLVEHGMNPAKANCVEIANSRKFLEWTVGQPFMVLHELAHAYHDQFLGGHNNPEIAAAYETAKKSGLYRSVLHFTGRMKPHYALTNPAEYFAESSEAYFGVNDFYPYVRSELLLHDPATGALMKRLWRAP